MKGKDLQIGQHVVLTKMPGRKKRRYQQATVLTVDAIAYPYAVFHYEASRPEMVLSSSGPSLQAGSSRETLTIDIRHCKFKRVSEEFALLSRHHGGSEGPPAWLTEPNSE